MKSILFIGNSYTYYSDMPEKLFAPMAEAAGFPCRVTSVTVGGCTLERFADENDGPGKKLRKAIAGQQYDIVVLQEQGLRPATEPEVFRRSVEALLTFLKPQAQHFMLYATPGRKDGHGDLEKLGLTSAELTEQLAASYDTVGRAFGLPAAQVGRVFLARQAVCPDEELYDADLLHPSLAGSTLAAGEILRVMMREYGKN